MKSKTPLVARFTHNVNGTYDLSIWPTGRGPVVTTENPSSWLSPPSLRDGSQVTHTLAGLIETFERHPELWILQIDYSRVIRGKR